VSESQPSHHHVTTAICPPSCLYTLHTPAQWTLYMMLDTQRHGVHVTTAIRPLTCLYTLHTSVIMNPTPSICHTARPSHSRTMSPNSESRSHGPTQLWTPYRVNSPHWHTYSRVLANNPERQYRFFFLICGEMSPDLESPSITQLWTPYDCADSPHVMYTGRKFGLRVRQNSIFGMRRNVPWFGVTESRLT